MNNPSESNSITQDPNINQSSSSCFFCKNAEMNDTPVNCLNCNKPICQQSLISTSTKPILKSKEEYICILCQQNQENKCNNCLRTNDLIKFTSIENIFDFIKEANDNNFDIDNIKQKMQEENIEINLFICTQCLNNIDFKNFDLTKYLALFGLLNQLKLDMQPSNRLQFKGTDLFINKVNDYQKQIEISKQNIQFLLSSSPSSCCNGPTTNNDKCSNTKKKNKTVLKESSFKEKEVETIQSIKSNSDNIKKENQLGMKTESNISYTINQVNEKENPLKYNSIYKEINSQLDIMKYCNKLHQNSLDSLTTYLEIYDKCLNEQMLLNEANENYLNAITLANNQNVNEPNTIRNSIECQNQAQQQSQMQNHHFGLMPPPFMPNAQSGNSIEMLSPQFNLMNQPQIQPQPQQQKIILSQPDINMSNNKDD